MAAKNKAQRVTKTGLVDLVADEAEITKADSKRVLDAMIDVIQEALKKGESVTLTGFGTFEVRTSKARMGVNPRTKEKIHIPATKRPAFKAGAQLNREVKG